MTSNRAPHVIDMGHARLAAGFNALRIDTGKVPKSGNVAVSDVQHAVTQYGPAVWLTFRRAEK